MARVPLRPRAASDWGGFALVVALFFAWGFVSSNNDPLIVAARERFGLSYAQGLAVQYMSFIAFGAVSLPAAVLAGRIGAGRAVLVALGVMVLGSLALALAGRAGGYGAVLASVAVLASGITMLQIAAGPLAAGLGPAETGAFRLTLAQAFNSVGVVVGVHYAALTTLGGGAPMEGVTRAYLGIAAGLVLVMLAVGLTRRRIAGAPGAHMPSERGGVGAALRSPAARFGAVAIGLYVGAEVTIGSVMISYLGQPGVMGLAHDDAARGLANFYWGGAMLGRFLGSVLLARVAARWLLAGSASGALILSGVALAGQGALAGGAALGVGLFNAILYPTIFALTLERTRATPAATSGLLGVAVTGGLVVALASGWLADAWGLRWAFLAPLVAYGVIARFAFARPDAEVRP